MTKLRYTMFVVTVLVALALSAMLTVPALADDNAPPPTDPTTTKTLPTAEVAPVVEEAAPAVDATLQDQAVTDVLASVPEGTDVVVVNAEGEAVPLASTEATDMIASADPQWCPAGVTPGGAGCSGTKTSFNGTDPANNLIQWLIDHPQSKAGVIWIEADYIGTSVLETGPIVLNGDSTLGVMANFALTINGGWTGSSAALNSNNFSEFNVPLSIYNWKNSITINNLLITGVYSPANPFFGAFALQVETNKGSITINNVDVNNNTADNENHGGAEITNYDSSGSGNININDSTFNGNAGAGIYIGSLGAITVKNMSANNNTQYGASIGNAVADNPKTVTLIGSNNFNFNGRDGLFISSLGAITVNNVTSIYNGGYGAFVDNCFYNYANQYCNNLAVSAVTIKGTNNFSNNGWDGLRIWSQGAITLQNVTANDNGTDALRPGATNASDPSYPYIGKYDGTGKGVFLFNWTYPAKAITLTGTNVFNGNAETGLFISSFGLVTVNNITANNNGHSSNSPTSISDGTTVHQSQGFMLLGYGVFNNNGDDGLEVGSYGAVTLNNLDAENNTWWGVGIDSYGAKSVVNVLGTNTFINNLNSGLQIWSQGAVTLNNITANDNGLDGVYVDNCEYDNYSDPSPLNWDCSVTTAKPVTLNGTNFFNDNTGTGFNVFSTGVITTNNITALFNGSGVYLDNCIWETDPLVDDCKALPGKAVTMNGTNNINFNAGDSLYVQSLGAIKVNNITASNNGGTGVTLDNNWTVAVGGVTITGFANTSMNGGRGIAIYSRGAVTTSNITANSNGPVSALVNEKFYDGVYINNATTPGKFMSVTLLGVNQFNDNWDNGLQINSYGIVVLNNVTANNNGEPYDVTNNPTPEGNGVKVDNSGASAAKTVTLNGINIFNGNLENGLDIQSLGAIVVNKVTANNNGINGAYLNNQFDFINSTLSLLGYGTFTGNNDTNLVVYSNGNVTLNNITANFSTGNGGAYVNNRSHTLTPVSVTLLGVNSFTGNAGNSGLVVFSDGAITLNNITANDNNGDGAYLDNTDYQILVPLKVANITLNGTNTFVGNVFNGLEFWATGNVSMTRVTADRNNDHVVDANYSAGILGTAAGTITLTCGSINFNEGSGYNLTAGVGKLVTLKGVFTYGNVFINYSLPSQ